MCRNIWETVVVNEVNDEKIQTSMERIFRSILTNIIDVFERAKTQLKTTN